MRRGGVLRSRSRARSITARTSARPAATALSSSNAASEAGRRAARASSCRCRAARAGSSSAAWPLLDRAAQRRARTPAAAVWPTSSSSVVRPQPRGQRRVRPARQRRRPAVGGSGSPPNSRSMPSATDDRARGVVHEPVGGQPADPVGAATPARSVNRPPASRRSPSAPRGPTATPTGRRRAPPPPRRRACTARSRRSPRVRQQLRAELQQRIEPADRAPVLEPAEAQLRVGQVAGCARPAGAAAARRTALGDERPAPGAAHQRRPSAGAETTPTVISPSCSSASSVAHTGIPRT